MNRFDLIDFENHDVIIMLSTTCWNKGGLLSFPHFCKSYCSLFTMLPICWMFLIG